MLLLIYTLNDIIYTLHLCIFEIMNVLILDIIIDSLHLCKHTILIKRIVTFRTSQSKKHSNV